MTITENNVAAQAGDEPMREALHTVDIHLKCAIEHIDAGRLDRAKICIATSRRTVQSVSPRATADVEREKLPHGHRDDFYLMANARSLSMNSIHTVRSMPNWVLAMKLFATGSTSAREICARAGIDPDGISIERATTKPGA